jgi:hypothetical protein
MADSTVVASSRILRQIVGTSAIALILVWAGRDVLPRSTDFLCYWTAGKLFANGNSPYDSDAPAHVQRDLGWSKDTQGGGRYEFLPFYCPPWFALCCAPFAALGYPTAERVWSFINIESLLLSSALLKDFAKGLLRAVTPLVVLAFFPTLVAVFAGQVSPVILLQIVAAWRLLDRRRDQFAGALLSCATIKPQLSCVLLAGILLWAARRRRWGVVGGFAAGLGLLCLASTAVVPSWPMEMLHATRVTPLPTDEWPWVGVSWNLALRTLGLSGGFLWLAYAAAAVPLTLLTLGAACDREGPLDDVLALGVTAAFFVSPYAQLYDFPVLVIPLVVLVGERSTNRTGAILLAAFLLLPYIHAYAMFYSITHNHYSVYMDKYLLIIIPGLLAAAWCWLRPSRLRPDYATDGAAGSLECADGSTGGVVSAVASGVALH